MAALRVLLLLTAAGAALVAFLAPAPGATEPTHAFYACPMHPEVRSNVREVCPICGMQLEALSPSRASLAERGGRGSGAGPQTHVEPGVVAVERLTVTSELRAPGVVEEPGVVVAHVYKDDLEWVATDALSWFSPTAAPATRVKVNRLAEAPTEWDPSVSLVRFALDSSADLPVGTVGRVAFPSRPRASLMMPDVGVLQGSDGPHVMVLAESGAIDRRSIAVGKVASRNAFIVDGLREGERVATTNAFLLDAERRHQAASGLSVSPRQ